MCIRRELGIIGVQMYSYVCIICVYALYVFTLYMFPVFAVK